MAEHRGIHHFMGILTQPLFAATTTKYQSRSSGSKKQPRTETFDVKGVLEVKGERYLIDGEEFVVSAETWVVGVPRSGVMAKVKGTIEEGVAVATCLVVS